MGITQPMASPPEVKASPTSIFGKRGGQLSTQIIRILLHLVFFLYTLIITPVSPAFTVGMDVFCEVDCAL